MPCRGFGTDDRGEAAQHHHDGGGEKDAIDEAVRPLEHGRPLAHHETQVIGDAGQRPEKGGPERGEPERVQCAPDGGREAQHHEIHRDVRGKRHGERRPPENHPDEGDRGELLGPRGGRVEHEAAHHLHDEGEEENRENARANQIGPTAQKTGDRPRFPGKRGLSPT